MDITSLAATSIKSRPVEEVEILRSKPSNRPKPQAPAFRRRVVDLPVHHRNTRLTMAAGKDWLPGRREAQLAMAKDWQTVLAVKAQGWNIPLGETAALAQGISAAETVFAAAQSSERTSVITAQCKEAFEGLTEKMRFIKNRYFLSPPLSAADLTALELKPKDGVHTARGAPRAQMTAEIGRRGAAMLILKLMYAEGTEDLADPRTDEAFQIRYGKYAPAKPRTDLGKGEIAAIPASPEELPLVFTTRRKKEIITFEPGDSGKTAYFAIRIDNGKALYGPWCPLFNAVIP